MGGASGAFGLPQAAAKRIFAGRSPHPLPSGVLKHGIVEQEDTPVAAVPALCADFGGGVRAVHLLMVFRRCWAVCEAGPVRTIQIQRKNASGGPVSGPLEAFDFSTRIKDRRR